jgi:hypothetical protein
MSRASRTARRSLVRNQRTRRGLVPSLRVRTVCAVVVGHRVVVVIGHRLCPEDSNVVVPRRSGFWGDHGFLAWWIGGETEGPGPCPLRASSGEDRRGAWLVSSAPPPAGRGQGRCGIGVFRSDSTQLRPPWARLGGAAGLVKGRPRRAQRSGCDVGSPTTRARESSWSATATRASPVARARVALKTAAPPATAGRRTMRRYWVA